MNLVGFISYGISLRYKMYPDNLAYLYQNYNVQNKNNNERIQLDRIKLVQIITVI